MDLEDIKQLKNYGLIPCNHSEATVCMISGSNKFLGDETEGYVDMATLCVPENITSIKWNGLGRVKFEKFIVADNNKVFQAKDGVLYTKRGYDRDGASWRKLMIELVACPTLISYHNTMEGTKRIANCAFKGCLISELILPQGLEEIGTNAFYMAQNLRIIEIPLSLRLIEPQSKVSFTRVQYGTQSFNCWESFLDYLQSVGFVKKNGKIILRNL